MRAASSAGSTTPSRVRSSLPLAKKCVVGYVSKAWDLLDFAASARDVHFCLAHFNVGKFCGDFFEDRIVGLAGLTGGEAIGHDRTGAVGEFLVIVVADVENRT